MPSLNAARWIRRALQSAVDQKPAPKEIFVVDGGSTDGTQEEASGVADIVRVLDRPGMNQAAATNEGIRHASGELIAPLDADDEWLPDKLSAQLQALERMPEAGIVYCDLWQVDLEGNELGRWLPQKEHASEGWVFESLLQQCYVLPSAALIRRKLFTDEGLRFSEDLEVAEDYEFWLRSSLRAPFARVATALVRRTVRPDAKSMNQRALHSCHVTLMRRLREELLAREGRSLHLPTLDRRLAGFELSLGMDHYRAGDVAAARLLLVNSMRRRPTGRTLLLLLAAMAGPPGRALLGLLRRPPDDA